jgi:hypothetical protein
MSANVYTSLSNTVVYTDKLEISTVGNAVTYQVYVTALGSEDPVGNIYSAAITIPANTITQVYSGAGNRVTITGTPFTALELGTASSAQAGVIAG